MPGINEGLATLIATLVGLVAVYVRYRLGVRNTLILLANALSAEVTITYDLQVSAMRRNRVQIETKAREGKEKFSSWSGRPVYTIYDNSTKDMLLLPESTLTDVVKFYQYDSWLQNKIINMSSDQFSTLSTDMRVKYVADIFDNIDNDYTTHKNQAVNGLQKITRKVRLPW